jgi:hypothetical protein
MTEHNAASTSDKSQTVTAIKDNAIALVFEKFGTTTLTRKPFACVGTRLRSMHSGRR